MGKVFLVSLKKPMILSAVNAKTPKVSNKAVVKIICFMMVNNVVDLNTRAGRIITWLSFPLQPPPISVIPSAHRPLFRIVQLRKWERLYRCLWQQ